DQSVPLLSGRLPRHRPADQGRVPRLIADLDSEKFQVREKAMQELTRLGRAAERGLRQVLLDPPSLEVPPPAPRLLAKPGSVKRTGRAPEQLRPLRALEVLEHVADAAARRLLGELAEGADEADLTQEAQATLQRLDRRRPGGR